MRVLLINLTRFGDLLQSQPLINDLNNHGHSVTMLCLEPFMGATKLLHGLDHVVALPGVKVLRQLDEDWRQGCVIVDDFAKTVQREYKPQLVLNLTASLSGRLMGRRLALEGQNLALQGFALDDFGFTNNSSTWVSFFEASTRQRGCSPYNIVDMFRKIGGLAIGPANARLREPLQEDVRSMREHLLSAASAHGLPKQDALGQDALGQGGFVGFQLGASEKRRQWPIASFAKLGEILASRYGIIPVLLGTKTEEDLAKQYIKEGAPCVNQVGKTSLTELSATLKNMRLLVTNDTGTMHLAAGLGVPCLAFFLATAQPWDTGPYLEDCCCLEPDLPCHPCGFGSVCPHGLHDEKCRTHISADIVIELIGSWLCTGSWPCNVQQEGPAKARIWRTKATSDRSGWNHMGLCSLSGHEHEARSILMNMQRNMLSQFIDAMDADDAEHVTFWPPEKADLALLPMANRSRLLDTLVQADGFLHLLGEQGRLVGVMPKSGEKFLLLIHRVTQLFENEPALDSLGRLWTVYTQQKGDDLKQVLVFIAQVRRWLAVIKQGLV